RHLRVCYSNRVSHTNCCKCEKCIRVVTAFRISGSPIPQAFRHEITDRQIRRLRLKRSIYKTAWRKLIVEIDKRGLWENSWARAIRTAVRRNRIRWIKARLTRRFLPIRNRIRTLLRGSPLSRSELSQQSAEDRRP
ncbi:MAG: hypothetical protein QGH94_19975, partial [Phycisphaerae bacterium]|nr:hypothetical protein [Phycisphaerae bacterium]